jgi:P-type Ca2+ transporter type 2C
VAAELGVDPERGLSGEEAASRLQSHGPNRLVGAKKESALQAFLRQYQDFMQLILLAAAVINLLVTGDIGTSVVLAGLTVFNVVIEELIKLVIRRRHRRAVAPPNEPAPSGA